MADGTAWNPDDFFADMTAGRGLDKVGSLVKSTTKTTAEERTARAKAKIAARKAKTEAAARANLVAWLDGCDKGQKGGARPGKTLAETQRRWQSVDPYVEWGLRHGITDAEQIMRGYGEELRLKASRAVRRRPTCRALRSGF